MTDYSKPAPYDPSDWVQVEERRRIAADHADARRPTNFVAPLAPGESPKPIVRRMEPQTPMEIDAPMPVQTVQRLATSHVDRAKGFSIVSLPMAAGVGLGGLLLAVGLFEVPLFSMAALLTLFLAFLATWLAAFLWYQSASPDGIGLWTVLLHYRLLSREQKARLRRMELDE